MTVLSAAGPTPSHGAKERAPTSPRANVLLFTLRREDAALAFFEGCQLAPDNKEFEAAFKGAIAEARKEYLAANPSAANLKK